VIKLTSTQIEALREEHNRRNFHAYRRHITKSRGLPFIDGWFQQDVASHLMQFWREFIEGQRPVLVISAPPQHGKTTQIVDFVSWALGKNPNLRTIYTSYSDSLGIKANLNLQRIMATDGYKTLFKNSRLGSSARNFKDQGEQVTARKNTGIVELVNRQGYFMNTTVNGQITGESLDLGIVDDPIKGRKAAQSPAIRQATWDWFIDDFFTRFSERSGLLVIATRWHVDDPTGRMSDHFPNVKILNYPALADEDEVHRLAGEPLFPELKSKEFLLERKKVMVGSRWEGLYQGKPRVEGAGMFKIEFFQIVDFTPGRIKRTIRYWDKAGTEDGGAFSAGVLMGITDDGQFVVLDVKRGQMSAFKRERMIKSTAALDGIQTEIMTEQEPGSGGKESAQRTVAMLAGYKARAERSTGSKELRAEAYAAQVEAGNVFLLRGEWNKDFIDEHEGFPSGKFKDQVDAASGAFNNLAEYNLAIPDVR
jgi:predicted phage terminase large subunit-like protein